jgi:hypothetical protein
MEDIRNTGSDTATIETKILRPGLIVQALAFTGILYFSVGHTPPNTTGAIHQSVQTSVITSASVGHSVLHHASQHSGLPASSLRIVSIQSQTWSDSCLGLGNAELFCTQIPVSGWQIAIASGQQRWIYRTNASASVIKLENGASSPSTNSKELASQS